LGESGENEELMKRLINYYYSRACCREDKFLLLVNDGMAGVEQRLKDTG